MHPSSHKSNTVTVLAFLNALWVQVGDFFLPHPFQTEPNSSQLLTEVLTWRKVKSVVEHQQGSDSFPPVVTVTSSGSLLPLTVILKKIDSKTACFHSFLHHVRRYRITPDHLTDHLLTQTINLLSHVRPKYFFFYLFVSIRILPKLTYSSTKMLKKPVHMIDQGARSYYFLLCSPALSML